MGIHRCSRKAEPLHHVPGTYTYISLKNRRKKKGKSKIDSLIAGERGHSTPGTRHFKEEGTPKKGKYFLEIPTYATSTSIILWY